MRYALTPVARRSANLVTGLHLSSPNWSVTLKQPSGAPDVGLWTAEGWASGASPATSLPGRARGLPRAMQPPTCPPRRPGADGQSRGAGTSGCTVPLGDPPHLHVLQFARLADRVATLTGDDPRGTGAQPGAGVAPCPQRRETRSPVGGGHRRSDRQVVGVRKAASSRHRTRHRCHFRTAGREVTVQPTLRVDTASAVDQPAPSADRACRCPPRAGIGGTGVRLLCGAVSGRPVRRRSIRRSTRRRPVRRNRLLGVPLSDSR